MNYIIEGCDRLGKDTFIETLKNKFGYFTIIHHSKPVFCEFYKHRIEKNPLPYKNSELFLYQLESFNASMALLKFAETSKQKFILNRSWLGEAVYAPRYRGYSGDYIFDLEKNAGLDKIKNTKLILLVTSNWSHIQDDGQSFDFSAKEEEQEDFIKAIQRSIFSKRQIIDICRKDGTRKTPQELFEEIS